MAYLNKTKNFALPQYKTTEKPQMNDFNTAFKNIDEMAFLVTGGTFSGDIKVEKKLPYITISNTSVDREIRLYHGTDGVFYLRNVLDDNNRTAIYLQPETISNFNNALRLQKIANGETSYYSIWGDHNKPTGSYTGNGSAAQRTIDIGGNSSVIAIRSSKGSALVNLANCLCYNASAVTVIGSAEIALAEGALTLLTTNACLNANGVKYYYYSL